LKSEIEARPFDRRVVITALGIAQILAWGTSFYFPAVFAEPIVSETGWSLGWVVGGTSIGDGNRFSETNMFNIKSRAPCPWT
jgi:hypothetical protein